MQELHESTTNHSYECKTLYNFFSSERCNTFRILESIEKSVSFEGTNEERNSLIEPFSVQEKGQQMEVANSFDNYNRVLAMGNK